MDFFYITTETTPSQIEPSKKLQEEYRLNKRVKSHYSQTEESLLRLSDNLVNAENYLKDGAIPKCFNQYMSIAQEFE